MEFMFRDLEKLFKKNERELDNRFDNLCENHSIGNYAGKVKDALGSALQKAMRGGRDSVIDFDSDEPNKNDNLIVIKTG